MTSHATEAADALRAAQTEAMRPVAAAVATLRCVQGEVRETPGDLVPLIGSIAGMVLALEGLQAAASLAEADLRRALAQAMSLGATTVRTDSLTVSLKDGARTVLVTDPAAIPAEFLRQPPPAPDKKAIGERLRKGETVPGATLSNGGTPVIAIRVNERRAA